MVDLSSLQTVSHFRRVVSMISVGIVQFSYVNPLNPMCLVVWTKAPGGPAMGQSEMRAKQINILKTTSGL